jgi:hypothetical protein
MMDLMGFAGLAALGVKGLFKAFGGLIRGGVRGVGDDLFRAGGALARTRLGRDVAKARAKPGCANSFTADTKVWVSNTANDLTIKAKSTLEKTKTIAKTAIAAVAISSIGIGTQVLAHNEQTKLESPQVVTATINHTDPIIVKLTLETNDKKLEVIEATPEHPFYALLEPKKNASGIWVNAGELQPNNWLRRANGETGIVKKLEWLTKTKRMYNLTVARDHTFFVGDGQWLVHNQNESPASNFTPGHGLRGDSDTKNVIRLAQEMAANGWANLPPIRVVMVDGKMVVVDGMHRLAAAQLTGTPIVYEIVDEAWLRQNTGWKSLADVAQDIAIGDNRTQLNRRLIEKAGIVCQ